MRWAWAQPVRGNRKLVLLALADHADDAARCWPKQTTVAALCGLDEKTVINHLKVLEAGRLISRTSRKRRDGAPTSDLYVLNVPRDFVVSNLANRRHPAGNSPQPHLTNLQVVKRETPGEPPGEGGTRPQKYDIAIQRSSEPAS